MIDFASLTEPTWRLHEAIYEMALHDAARKLDLTEDEANIVLEACHGFEPAPETIGQQLRARCTKAARAWADSRPKNLANVAITSSHMRRSLLDRLRDLPNAYAAAVELWAVAYWDRAAIAMSGGEASAPPLSASAASLPGSDRLFAVWRRKHLGLLVRARVIP